MHKTETKAQRISICEKADWGSCAFDPKTPGENEWSDRWSTHLRLSRIMFEIFERPAWAISLRGIVDE